MISLLYVYFCFFFFNALLKDYKNVFHLTRANKCIKHKGKIKLLTYPSNIFLQCHHWKISLLYENTFSMEIEITKRKKMKKLNYPQIDIRLFARLLSVSRFFFHTKGTCNLKHHFSYICYRYWIIFQFIKVIRNSFVRILFYFGRKLIRNIPVCWILLHPRWMSLMSKRHLQQRPVHVVYMSLVHISRILMPIVERVDVCKQ